MSSLKVVVEPSAPEECTASRRANSRPTRPGRSHADSARSNSRIAARRGFEHVEDVFEGGESGDRRAEAPPALGIEFEDAGVHRGWLAIIDYVENL